MPDLYEDRSYFWNEKYYLTYKRIIGYVAYIVTSKLAGIGSDKRSWGDVKHLKSNKLSHLSSESVKMQAIIYSTEKCDEANTNLCTKEMADPVSPISLIIGVMMMQLST